MNLNEWIYHLSLRTALHRNDLLDPRPPPRRARERAALGVRRAAIAFGALVAPVLLVVSALLGQ